MESVAYVGMDVDKEKIVMAVVCGYEPDPRIERVIRNRADAITKFFAEVSARYENLMACYEAGDKDNSSSSIREIARSVASALIITVSATTLVTVSATPIP